MLERAQAGAQVLHAGGYGSVSSATQVLKYWARIALETGPVWSKKENKKDKEEL